MTNKPDKVKIKNPWTGEEGEVTPELVETVDSMISKAVLYGILTRQPNDETAFSKTFLDFLAVTGKIFNEEPDLAKSHVGDGTPKEDFAAMMVIISRYLAGRRLIEQRTAGLSDWELDSVSGKVSVEEINREEEKLALSHEHMQELGDLAKLLGGMLLQRTKRNRMIPLLKDMGRNRDYLRRYGIK